MAIPFLNLIRSVKARLFPSSDSTKPASAPLVRAEKDEAQRLRKTVVPSANRAKPAVDPFEAAAAASGPKPKTLTSSPPTGIPFDPTPRFSLSRGASKTTPAPAQSHSERAISLQLRDVIDQLPTEQIKARESFDEYRAIVLKASEIEKGMATGTPSVALTSIYQQAPEIFQHAVAPDDTTQVSLPFPKVLEQFEKLHVRADQVTDPDVPQLETPILKVTMEDTERFGTAMQPLQVSPVPPVKVEPATAKALAAAEPEPVAREVTPVTATTETSHRRIKPPSATPVPDSSSPTSDTPVSPSKIPFHLPPNGTGVPASEKVPASSGPPVPTVSLPTSPRRIPMEFASKPEDLRPKFTLVPGVEPKEKPAAPAQPSGEGSKTQDAGPKIKLSLQAVLHALPGFQLNGDPMTVADDVAVEFPLSLIEPQLASGRVVVPAKVFQCAIPEKHRALFVLDASETPVSLPLQDILEHLPPSALRMRGDQEEVVVPEKFTTPFSIQADEDAKRFEAMATGGSKTPDETTTEDSEEEQHETSTDEVVPKKDSIDPKEIVAGASVLPGVNGCAVAFADGLSVAGNLPSQLHAEGLCAMAPSILQKIDKALADAKLGELVAMTLHCEKSALTFLMHRNICLTAAHTNVEELGSETRNQLAAMVQELGQAYSHSDLSHVDH